VEAVEAVAEDEELVVAGVEAAEALEDAADELEALDVLAAGVLAAGVLAAGVLAAGVLAAGVLAAGVLAALEGAPATEKLQGLPAPGNEIITGIDTEMLGVEQTPRMLTYPTSQTHS
jgi:hypothetical protein